MIGIFDSGLGGLTVAREIMRILPDYPVVYFGDTARAPYGGKSEETIKRYALEDAEFLVSHGAKILVIACNTASAVATDVLREKYKIPVFEVITPAAKRSAETTKTGRIGIIGTRATISSGVYEKKIKEFGLINDPEGGEKVKVFSEACPLLVPLVEENWINRPETKSIVRKYLGNLKSAQIDTLILGCTHYPFLKSIIQNKIGRKIKIVDSAEEIAKELKNFIEKDGFSPSAGESKFFASDITPHLEKMASKWLEKNIKVEKSVL